jgi:uncharacterized sulfatase
MFQTPTTAVWKRMFDEGRLNPAQRAFWEPKPSEELYDLQTDRWEVANLVDSPGHAVTLSRMRAALDAQMSSIRDVGLAPEYELHRGSVTPYERREDVRAWDFPSVHTAARQASDRSVPVAALRPLLGDADPIVRYWAATGVVIRGADAVRDARADLVRLLGDAEPGPRIAAAEGLARFGEPSDRSRAIAQLLADADATKTSEFAALFALYSLNQVPNLPGDVRQAVQELPAAPLDAGRELRSREDYLPRLKEAIANDVR